jgi:hypothetical protein
MSGSPAMRQLSAYALLNESQEYLAFFDERIEQQASLGRISAA